MRRTQGGAARELSLGSTHSLRVSSAARNVIVSTACSSPRAEVGGLLLGRDGSCSVALPVPNAAQWASSSSYVARVDDVERARRDGDAGLDQLGWFHSHCFSGATPGHQDVRNAPPASFQVIVSVSDLSSPVVRAWWVDEARAWHAAEVVDVA